MMHQSVFVLDYNLQDVGYETLGMRCRMGQALCESARRCAKESADAGFHSVCGIADAEKAG